MSSSQRSGFRRGRARLYAEGCIYEGDVELAGRAVSIRGHRIIAPYDDHVDRREVLGDYVDRTFLNCSTIRIDWIVGKASR